MGYVIILWEVTLLFIWNKLQDIITVYFSGKGNQTIVPVTL